MCATARSIAEMPRGIIERSNPVDEEDEKLEYDVYGWWRFDEDAAGVRRLGRQWIAVDQLSGFVEGWVCAKDAFEARVAKLAERYV